MEAVQRRVGKSYYLYGEYSTPMNIMPVAAIAPSFYQVTVI
ncbi:MAG TPA: hypothetical protein V6C91_07175 [Coleofasciculaceae cyanobacterium]